VNKIAKKNINDIIFNQVDLNPKHEMRISKQSQMTKFQMFKTKRFFKFEF